MLGCWNWVLESMTWCNRLRFIYKIIYLCFLVSLKYLICINWLFEHTHPTSLTLYMTWVHEELHKRFKSWIPIIVMSCPQFVHVFRLSIWDCSTLPPNWNDSLSCLSRWFSHGECSSACDAQWTWPMVNHDTRISIFMIH